MPKQDQNRISVIQKLHDRAKTLNGKKLFYYNNIINYIKNQNKNIFKTKPETKIVYQKIIQEGTKQYAINTWRNAIEKTHTKY